MKKTVITIAAIVVATIAAAQNEPPKLKSTPDQPILMVGDSMMRLLAIEFERSFRKLNLTAASFSSLGSGLIRLDAFDWFGKIDDLITTHHPKTIVVTLGANDNQALLSDEGNTIPPGTTLWDDAYTARLGKVMDTFAANGVTRVIWILLPDMQAPAHQRYAEHFNTLLTNAAATRDFVILYDPRPPLSRRAKTGYAATVITPEGRAVQVRSADGIHLSREGAQRVAADVIKEYWN